MFLSIYRVCITEIYKGKQRCGKKVAGKVKNVRKECFLIQYNRDRGNKGGKRAGQRYVHYIQNTHTNIKVYFQRTYVRYIIRSNVYPLSARLCVLSAQHMNTCSHNVYAEKHMFDFYNKFLRIFQTCVRLYKCKTNKCVYVLIRIREKQFAYMNICSHDT